MLKNVFEKKYLGEMLIEQIIEFKLRGLGPLDRTCSPTTGYFHVKTKIRKSSRGLLFTTKILTKI